MPLDDSDSPSSPSAIRIGERYTGIFQSASTRGGFVVLESAPGLPDIFVPSDLTGAALHGDEVFVHVLRHREGRASEGEIEKVLKHANKQIVGQLRRTGKICLVAPKNRKIRRLVAVRRTFSLDEIPEEAWVVVEIEKWPKGIEEPLEGKVIEVLGTEKDRGLPILLLIRQDGVRSEFPREVEAEAAEIAKRDSGNKIESRRKDLRASRVMTIDPATAKDFDDAIGLIEKRADGWRVAVHIADVAHFVPEGSKTDIEAYDRATSIYPVDRVVPMLPEILSNGICSLRPDEDRRAMSAVFDVSHAGAVSNIELHESVIRSVRRFTYEGAQGLMDRADGIEDSRHPITEIPPELFSDLMELRAASNALFRARMNRGALDLDLPESEVWFDANGVVAGLQRKERIESHRLIEDLMLAANEAVARELTRLELPLLYRIHESPAEDKLLALAPVLAKFGLRLPSKGSVSQAQLQEAIRKAQAHPAGAIAQRLVLRSLMRAQYRGNNVGHFGLASGCYTHFTSPIRRYPDLIVHRAVKAAISGEAAMTAWRERAAPRMEEWGRHTSGREERAQEIEMQAKKIVTLEYMKRFTGDVFDGFISGLISRGFFVELTEYPAEGFVPVASITDDFYDYDSETMTLFGRRGQRAFSLGDPVKVQIGRVDILAGEMDLNLVRGESKRANQKPGEADRRRAKKLNKGGNWRNRMKRKMGKQRR